MFANRLRNERLKKSLDVLNRIFEKTRFLVGKNLTLADISLVVQLMPVLDQDMVTICPNIKVIEPFVYIIDMNELIQSVDSLYFCYWNVYSKLKLIKVVGDSLYLPIEFSGRLLIGRGRKDFNFRITISGND